MAKTKPFETYITLPFGLIVRILCYSVWADCNLSYCLRECRGMKLRGRGGTLKPLQKCGFPPLPLTFLPLRPSFPSPLDPYSALLTACGRESLWAWVYCRSSMVGLFAQSWDGGSSITLIIVIQHFEEIPRAWLYFCPFLIFSRGT